MTIRLNRFFLVFVPVCLGGVLLLASGGTALAEPPSQDPLYAHLLEEAKNLLKERARKVDALATPEELKAHSEWVPKAMIEAVGGLPAKSPLNATTVWSKDFGDHRIEGVIFESHPGIYVTANLYLPTSGEGPFPAVLGPCGHNADAKAGESYQPAWINLARRGFVVLSFDPLGQGERMNFLNEDGNYRYWGTTEHTMIGVQALLLGYSMAREFIWDGMRALDYLETRPEVDMTRVGCTGNSGGGTQTAYFQAVDPRIACSAPSCYITSLTRLFETIGPQDAEQNLIAQVKIGLDHADYVEACLPDPVLICAASKDFFDITGTWNTFREAKNYYGKYGFPERVDLIEAPDEHGFTAPRRTAMYHWMSRWLKGIEDTEPEGATENKPASELQCTQTGQVLTSLGGARSYAAMYGEEAAALREARRSQKVAPGDTSWIDRIAEMAAIDRPGELDWRRLPLKQTEGRLVQWSYSTEVEPGWATALKVYEPLGTEPGDPVVWVEDVLTAQPHPTLSSPMEFAMRESRPVIVLSPRGLNQPDRMKGNQLYQYFGDWPTSFLALHLGRPLLGQRVEDVLAALDYAAQRYPDRSITLIGSREGVPPAVLGAVMDNRVDHLILQEGLSTWESVYGAKHNLNVLSNVVPGILKVADLPDMVAGVLPRKVTLLTARSPEGVLLPKEAIARDYAMAADRAGVLGAPDAFQIAPE